MTHYEVLGVERGAGIDEIRAAYRARARDLHPDRRAADSAADRAADPDVALQMAAVNQAWAVLGDPARRAAYDRTLRNGATGGRANSNRPGDHVDGRRGSGAEPRDFDHLHRHGSLAYSAEYPPPVHSAMPGCFGSGALPWLALVALLIVIFVFTAYAGTSDDPDRTDQSPTSVDAEPPLVAVRDVRGMCVRVASGITSVVDCLTLPNEGPIVAQASIDGECPAGTNAWLLRHLDTLACTEASGPGQP